MAEEFLVFHRFTDFAIAEAVAEKLDAAGILLEMEDTSSPIDPVIIGTSSDADIRIKLRSQDFEKANAVLEAFYAGQADSISPDHYLFDFTNAELREIIARPDEWGRLDYHLAQKILAERGDQVLPDQVAALKARRIKEIAKTEDVGKGWIVLGYFIAVFFSLIGIFFGSVLAWTKKTLPNGESFHSYSERDRRHGKIIFGISCFLLAMSIALQLFAVTKSIFWMPF